MRGWYLPEATSSRDVRRPVGSNLTRMMPLSRVTEPSVLAGGGLEVEWQGLPTNNSPPPQPQPCLPTCSTLGGSEAHVEEGPGQPPPHPDVPALTSCRTNTGCWGRRGCSELGAGAGA